MTDIMKPHVNMNGTSRGALVTQRMEARRRLEYAIEAHREIAPHGRDYQGGGDYERDREIWRERHLQLEAIYQALEEEALFIHTED